MKLSYKHHTISLTPHQLECVKRHMRWVRAAGGVVSDQNGDMLLIERNNRWDLPKGKVEKGETLLKAALREVEEETGIKTECGPMLLKTYHIYKWGALVKTAGFPKGWHLKQTSWFCLKAVGNHPSGKPQDEEGITNVVWVSPEEWYRRLQHSYGTMKTIANKWHQSTT